jgi:hypothetical protein
MAATQKHRPSARESADRGEPDLPARGSARQPMTQTGPSRMKPKQRDQSLALFASGNFELTTAVAAFKCILASSLIWAIPGNSIPTSQTVRFTRRTRCEIHS